MTDYWISTKKHYCETCNCWISGHKVNIKNHEKSSRHIENFKRLINESFKRKEKETKDKEFIEKELRKLENVEKEYLSTLKKNDKSTQLDSSFHFNTCNSSNKNYQRWILMIHEDTGSLVFFNKLNNQITYEKPKDFYEKLPEYQTFSEQNGWFKYFDYNSNNFYYYNINNSEIIWQYSVSTINEFINFVKKYESLCKDKNLSNIIENINQNIKSNNLCNKINLNNNSYYTNYPVNFSQNNNFIFNNYNLLNLQGKMNLNDNIEKMENKKEKEKMHMIINSHKSNSNNDMNNLDNTNINNNTDNISNYGRINGNSSYNSFDKNDERISNLKNKTDDTIKKNKVEVESENYSNLNETNVINEKHKMDSKILIEEKQIKNNSDKEKKKKIIDINLSSKKANNTFSNLNDKKEYTEKIKKKNAKNTNYENGHEEKDECNKNECSEAAIPGAWQEVRKDISTISNESIEDIFYNIKSNREIEEEEIAQLQENIRYEYSTYNEFYIKKKELESEDLYLNQEFRFVKKPIYKKSIDKNINKKVEFAKRNIKITKNKKGVIK
ncbi:U1 small nuclear ribonucleoprotein C, putative [Plasmodium relictum]|uniref:U1 small nuclear ribonucleoprotein C, putative n=1 Tax=Plasmodium relictum TaxID=85471 RepID=A0A1J1HE85_PLARL|nr:U1 small nuclear ribonucleoprotein C, putative [Plasmodium relictum]CRH04111.1 U1 small nuclear ribonucleoprotein C, putative [Plasmodium relictum]